MEDTMRTLLSSPVWNVLYSWHWSVSVFIWFWKPNKGFGFPLQTDARQKIEDNAKQNSNWSQYIFTWRQTGGHYWYFKLSWKNFLMWLLCFVSRQKDLKIQYLLK
jgi:hypothetical protein